MNKNAIIAVLVILVLGLGIYMVVQNGKQAAQMKQMQTAMQNMQQSQSVPVTQTQTTQKSSTTQSGPGEGFISVPTSFTIDPKNPDVTTFISNDLGVEFSYINKVQVGQEGSATNPLHTETLPLPTESGTTISMDGEPIVVYDKNPDVSFSDSLKTHFLVGYDPSVCYPVIVSVPDTNTYEKGYETASIQYPPGDELGAPKPGTCPNQYAMTNGARYFLYNPAQPDRFLFLNPGQSVTAIAPGGQNAFESTIQIIAKQYNNFTN